MQYPYSMLFQSLCTREKNCKPVAYCFHSIRWESSHCQDHLLLPRIRAFDTFRGDQIHTQWKKLRKGRWLYRDIVMANKSCLADSVGNMYNV